MSNWVSGVVTSDAHCKVGGRVDISIALILCNPSKYEFDPQKFNYL